MEEHEEEEAGKGEEVVEGLGKEAFKDEALEADEEASGAQEESTVEPEEITSSMISLERFMQTDSQTVLSETSLVSRNCHSFIHS